VTVRSRCQRFDLRRLGADEIAHYLGQVLQQEKVAFESEALHEIAVAADGSVRDALSLAERVLAFAGKQLQAEDVRKALGLVGPEQARLLADAILSGDAKSAVDALRAAASGGHAPRSLLEALGELWHELACLMCDASLLESEPSQTQREWLESWVPCWDAQGLDLRYQVLVGGLRDFGWMDERRAAEMLVMRLAGLHAIYPPVRLPEKRTASVSPPARDDAPRPATEEAVVDDVPQAVEEDVVAAEPEPAQSKQEQPQQEEDQLALDGGDGTPPGLAYGNWEDAVGAYGKLRPGVSAMLEHVLCLDFGTKVRLALDSHQERAIAMAERMAFSEWLGRTIHWEPKQDEAHEGETIMQARAREAEARREQLEQTALNDPHVQQLMAGLDAELVRVRAPGSADEAAPE
jgi:DNA polymerase-3 subunit gamma/tau